MGRIAEQRWKWNELATPWRQYFFAKAACPFQKSESGHEGVLE
jgi:hypothetical protein